MGWFLGAGAFAAVIGGVWYWLDNRRREEVAAANGPLIEKIRCTLRAIETPGTAAASSGNPRVARVRLISVLNQLAAGSTPDQVTLPDVSAVELREALAELQSKPCPSLEIVLG
jgi:hypothetical protein